MIMMYAGEAKIGVYGIYIDNRLVYVGKSKDLRTRSDTHRTRILHSNDVWYPLARDFHQRGHILTLKVLEQTSLEDLEKTETKYIQKLKPLFNCIGMGEDAYQTMEYDYAVNKLFLGYRPPMTKQKNKEEKNWFGEEIQFRKW